MFDDSATLSKADILSQHELFSNLPSRVIQQLATHTRSLTYQAGDSIFSRGEVGCGLLAVLSGVVQISVSSEHGKEITLNLIEKNEFFGEIALLDGGPRTADANALTDCMLMSLDRRDFVCLLTHESAIAIKVLEAICRRLRRTTKQVEDLIFGDLRVRLARALLRLADIQGTITLAEPRLQITQKELGNVLGLSRESTNRHLREWEDAGLLALEKGRCIIKNPGRLARFAEGSAE